MRVTACSDLINVQEPSPETSMRLQCSDHVTTTGLGPVMYHYRPLIAAQGNEVGVACLPVYRGP
jgi:hypothetical protein